MDNPSNPMYFIAFVKIEAMKIPKYFFLYIKVKDDGWQLFQLIEQVGSD